MIESELQRSIFFGFWKSPVGLLLLAIVVAFSFRTGVSRADRELTTKNESNASTGVTETPRSEDSQPVAKNHIETAPVGNLTRGLRMRREKKEDEMGYPIALEEVAPGAALRHFHRSLKQTLEGKKKTRILFFGASHTAADIAPNLIRHKLQERFGDGGHGFIQLAKPWRHYRHKDVDLESSAHWRGKKIRWNTKEEGHYGLLGAYVEATLPNARGEISFPNRGFGSRPNLIDVYYMLQPGGGSFDVIVDDQIVGNVETEAAQEGVGFFRYQTSEEAVGSVAIQTLEKKPVRVFGATFERDSAGVVLDTLGINGARNRFHLLWSEDPYIEQLRRRRPDLVIYAYGTNEAGDSTGIDEYKEQLREVVARLRKAAPNASCLFVGPSDRPVKVGSDEWIDRPRTAEVISAQHQIAVESGCAFFDMVAFSGGPLSMVQWAAASPAYGAKDHIHYTYRGYRRWGEELYDAMMEFYEENTSGSPTE